MANQARRLIIFVAAGAALAACGRGPRRGEPLAGKLVATESAQLRGRLVFMQNCHSCHPGGEAGLGPSLNDRRSPALPAHPTSPLDEKQRKDLAAYLAALRREEMRLTRGNQ